MIKHLLLLFLLIGLTTNSIAQMNKCYTDAALKNYTSTAAQKQVYLNNQAAIKACVTANQNSLQRTNSIVTIPVVFHIVYKNATQNIADSNIFRQVDILNECYRLQNANFSQTRSIFDTIAADTEIEFCLASIDPSGNATTGITHTQAAAGTFFDPILGFDNVKSTATGGADPWPSDQYLNVWVCDMSFIGVTFVLGYATFPGGDPAVDGVVIQFDFIGYMDNQTTNDKGRTTVHEVGHWLGLRHIWGDGQGSAALCDSSDHVDDTPNADSASQQTCLIKNTCSNESPYWTLAGIDPPDMIENYMDYSYDDCMTMFTNGQNDRMHGTLNTLRIPILSSPGCGTFGISENKIEKITLYPNPVNDWLQIQTTIKGNVDLAITDVVGKTIRKFVVNGDGRFDVSDISSGILLYEIRKNGTILKTGKLVKTD